MPRPEKERIVSKPPIYSSFKPAGTYGSSLEESILHLDEYEAIRLADYLGLDHAEAAEEMEISRSTFTRLIEKARAKLAAFIIEGRLLRIDGGNIHFRGNMIHCQQCGYMFKTSFDNDFKECPSCGSKNLVDLAGGFGHGRCCRNHHHGGRR